MNTLGGSLFVHNAIEFDYCVEAAIHSLIAVCDEVAVLDAESDDGTLKLLRDLERRHQNLVVRSNGKWNCGKQQERLTLLANETKSLLRTNWHFMLQADEVLHESSFAAIRDILAAPDHKTYFTRRLNLFRDLNTQIKLNLPLNDKPCGDEIVRLGVIEAEAIGDAESLEQLHDSSREYLDRITIVHYGLVRNPYALVRKIVDMQSWFHSPEGVDPRIKQLEADGKPFDWSCFKTADKLEPRSVSHPIFVQNWIKRSTD